jgi:micrococcal nuclease
MATKKSKTPINVQNKQVEPFIYQATLVKVVDGDTIDVTLDLGFNVLLHNQRVRLAGIDTPESRTRNKEEKVLGLAAKARLREIIEKDPKFKVQSLGKGKYGRILGIPYTIDGQDICQMLIEEGHAREYDGGKKKSWT